MIKKYGEAEHITTTDDTMPEEIRKEATTEWTPQDTTALARENADSMSPGTDRS